MPIADRWRDDAIKSGAVHVLQQEHGVAAGNEDELSAPQSVFDLNPFSVFKIEAVNDHALAPQQMGRRVNERGRRQGLAAVATSTARSSVTEIDDSQVGKAPRPAEPRNKR